MILTLENKFETLTNEESNFVCWIVHIQNGCI